MVSLIQWKINSENLHDNGCGSNIISNIFFFFCILLILLAIFIFILYILFDIPDVNRQEMVQYHYYKSS